MPAAQYFYGKAKSNGFPFCLERVDVSGYDYWTTLGGTRKGSAPAAGEISISLQNAWRLFWNSYALSYTLEFSGSGDASGSINVEDDNSNQPLLPPGSTAPGVLPLDRLCENEFTSQTFVTTDGHGVAFGYPSGDFYVGFRSTAAAVPIVRMYDGATDVEANFVGYGVRSNYLDFLDSGSTPEPPDSGIFAPFYDDASGLPQYFVLQSYVDEIDAATDARFATDPDAADYAYTDLPVTGSAHTIPFVCGINYYGPGTVTLDASNRSALETSTPNDNNTVIDSIEFYTEA